MRGKGARSLLWQPDPEPFRLIFLPVVAYLCLYSLLAHKVCGWVGGLGKYRERCSALLA